LGQGLVLKVQRHTLAGKNASISEFAGASSQFPRKYSYTLGSCRDLTF